MRDQRLQRFIPLLFLIAVSAAAGRLRADLIAHWSLDNETAGLENMGSDGATSDLIAATPEGDVTGGPTITTTGGAASGYASFDGSQALVATTVGNAAEDLAGFPFTYSAWVRPSSVNPARATAVGMINGTALDQYISMGIETPGEGQDLQTVRRNGDFVATEAPGTSGTIHNGEWHHIASVFSAENAVKLYLDGSLVGDAANSVAFPSGINSIGVGAMRRSSGFIDLFQGDIDDVQIYDQALVPEQVEFLFNNPGQPTFTVLPGDVNLDNLVDTDDLQIIADNFFNLVVSRQQGDLNGDGIVNFTDFRQWKNAASGATAGLGNVNVPEPATLVTLLAWCLTWTIHRTGVRRK